MKGFLRSKIWRAGGIVVLVVATTAGLTSAAPEDKPKPVVVTNQADQAIPVAVEGMTGVEGDVHVTNPTLSVEGTVDVGNLPAVQDVNITNDSLQVSSPASTLRRGVLATMEGAARSQIPGNVVLTDVLAYGDCAQLFINEGTEHDLGLPLFADVIDGGAQAGGSALPIQINLQSGLRGPLVVTAFAHPGCDARVLWTGYEV